MSDLLIAAIVFGTIFAAELPDNSGLASLVLGTRYRPGGVFAGAAAAFAVHVVLAVTCGSILGLLPHKIVQIAVAVVFLAGAVLVLRADSDDEDEARLKAGAAGFWAVAATSFGVIALAELGDLSDIMIVNLAARYHHRWRWASGACWRCGRWPRWPSLAGEGCCGSCRCGGSPVWPR